MYPNHQSFKRLTCQASFIQTFQNENISMLHGHASWNQMSFVIEMK